MTASNKDKSQQTSQFVLYAKTSRINLQRTFSHAFERGTPVTHI